MNKFVCEDFFSLEETKLSALWVENEEVWRALVRIEAFCKSQKVTQKIPPHVEVDQPQAVIIEEGVVFEPHVYIQGPCYLGAGTVVRHGAYLRGGVICGERCVIGHGSEIKRSILLESAQIAHLVYVGDSILGRKVNLGAGVKCANLRLDRGEVTLHHDGQKISTGLKKFGSVLGDGCQVGCNSVLNPGTILGPKCVVYPLAYVQGVIPANRCIKSNVSRQESAL